MKIIGILGGVASGKSLVAEELRRLGAEVLDADRLGHEVLREPEVIRACHDRWGDRVLSDDGQLNRSQIARIVFEQTVAGNGELAFLEQLTHPRIGARIEQQLDAIRQNEAPKAVVLDAPVMLKSGWNKYCDHILFIEASRELRLERAKQRGWSDLDFAARESSQQSLDAKRAASSHKIDNSGTADATRQQVETFWQALD